MEVKNEGETGSNGRHKLGFVAFAFLLAVLVVEN